MPGARPLDLPITFTPFITLSVSINIASVGVFSSYIFSAGLQL